jgi:hypothetical protein
MFLQNKSAEMVGHVPDFPANEPVSRIVPGLVAKVKGIGKKMSNSYKTLIR